MTGRSPLREPSGPLEFFLGILAIMSVGIFLIPYLDVFHLAFPPQWQRYLITFDVSVCVVFAIDLLLRMGRSGQPLQFLRSHPLQPFAVVPLNTPIVADIQIILVLIVIARFVRATNVVFGDRFVQSIFARYSGMIAREVSDAVLLRILNDSREIVARGRFAKSIADALDRRRGELHGIVQDSLSRAPGWQAFSKVPGTTELVERGERLVTDAVLEVLRSERLNVLVANIVDDSLEDFKLALEQEHPGLALDALGPTMEEQERLAAADRARGDT